MKSLSLRLFVIISLSFSVVSQAETLKLVFSESDPPTSSKSNEQAVGVFPDLAKLVFSFIPEYSIQMEAVPWARAQRLVELGERDGFLTYPSKSRKKYASFSVKPVFIQDYGYLVYHIDNPNRQQLEWAKSFKDLSGLKVVVENGSEWERDNIPSSIERVKALNADMKVHLLFLRKAADYEISAAEVAVYHAKKFGYHKEMAYTPVKFINDSLIPFHLGLSKLKPDSAEIISKISGVIESSEFIKARQIIIDRYR